MDILGINIVVIFVVLIIIGIAIVRGSTTSETGLSLPYYKKEYLLTVAEYSFFKVLEQAVGAQYYIFSQVNLARLIRSNARGSEYLTYFHKISQKSVDFVLAEKIQCKPILAIELDDSSHNVEKRQARDEFCNRVFESAGLPILHVAYKKWI